LFFSRCGMWIVEEEDDEGMGAGDGKGENK